MGRSTLARRTERLAEDLRNVVTDSESLLRELGSELNERGKQAKARLSATLDAAKATCHDLQEQTAERIKAADEMAREHPYRVAGATLIAGVLIGLLLGRRR